MPPNRKGTSDRSGTSTPGFERVDRVGEWIDRSTIIPGPPHLMDTTCDENEFSKYPTCGTGSLAVVGRNPTA